MKRKNVPNTKSQMIVRCTVFRILGNTEHLKHYGLCVWHNFPLRMLFVYSIKIDEEISTFTGFLFKIEAKNAALDSLNWRHHMVWSHCR